MLQLDDVCSHKQNHTNNRPSFTTYLRINHEVRRMWSFNNNGFHHLMHAKPIETPLNGWSTQKHKWNREGGERNNADLFTNDLSLVVMDFYFIFFWKLWILIIFTIIFVVVFPLHQRVQWKSKPNARTHPLFIRIIRPACQKPFKQSIDHSLDTRHIRFVFFLSHLSSVAHFSCEHTLL